LLAGKDLLASIFADLLSGISDKSDLVVRFANSTNYLIYDSAANMLWLSPLLDWYGGDWEHVGGHLLWLADRVKDEPLKQAIQRAARGEVQVAFLTYDWSLNSQASIDSPAPVPANKKGKFGSGSIPNE